MKMNKNGANKALEPKDWRIVGDSRRYQLEIRKDGEWVEYHKLNCHPVFRTVAEAFMYAINKSENP